MIYDKIENLKKYTGFNQSITTVIDYLENNDCLALKEGVYAIDEDRCKVLRQSVQSAPLNDRGFEFHRKYMDLQIVLTGVEICYVDYIDDLDSYPGYDPEGDIAFYQQKAEAYLVLKPGMFVLLEPNDGHFPCRAYHGESCQEEKLCFKLLV